MRKLPLVSIITVNYNGLQMTCELLESIRRISYPAIETWVIDNASRENPQAFLAENYPEVKFMRSEINLGFAGGNNLAVRRAKGDFMLFINNDAEITEGCLEKLIALFEANPKAGAVSPMLCYFTQQKPDTIQYCGMTQVSAWTARNKTIGEDTTDEGQFSVPTQTAYAHGAAMLIKREVIENVGLMHEDYFLYYEELDWCERIRRAGYEIYVEPRAKVYHKESASVGLMSPLKTYYLNRNRIYFMRRNFNGASYLAFILFFNLVALPKNLLSFMLKGQFEHAKVFIRAVIWNIKDSFSRVYADESESRIRVSNT